MQQGNVLLRRFPVRNRGGMTSAMILARAEILDQREDSSKDRESNQDQDCGLVISIEKGRDRTGID